jgi:hypothetical protein
MPSPGLRAVGTSHREQAVLQGREEEPDSEEGLQAQETAQG